jgi:hypothetical protein
MRRLWVLSVTGKGGFQFQPEVYRSRQTAMSSFSQWAGSLGGVVNLEAEGASLGESVNRKVGSLFVSVSPVVTDQIESNAELWVGAVFGRDGSIVEGPVLRQHLGHARGWVQEQGLDDPHRRSSEPPGEDNRAHFKRGRRSLIATATRAKVIAPFAAVLTYELPEIVQPSTYDIDVVATFTHIVSTSVSGQPGLSREALESRIDEDFPHLGLQRGVLTDLTWELDGYQERPGLRYRVQPGGDDPEEPLPRIEPRS